MKTSIYVRQLSKPGIAKAVAKVLKVITFILLLCASNSYASNKAQLKALTTTIKSLEKSIQQDQRNIKQLERQIWGLDAKILDAQKQIRKERDQQRAHFHDIKRTVKRQGFDIKRLENSIALINQNIELVQRDSQRSQEYFNSLNALKRQFEETSHLEKLRTNQAKVEAFLTEKQTLIEAHDTAVAKQNILKNKLIITEAALENTAIEDDPRFSDLVKNREKSGQRITTMRKEVKKESNRLALLSRKAKTLKISIAKNKPKPTVKPVLANEEKPQAIKPKHSAYVFVISGQQEPNIEDSLKLKDWVESYGAQYIQAHWNGIEENPSSESTDNFKRQFMEQLANIDESAKIILIGHGRGGGAAIEAATDTAFNANRTIEFLAVIDPIGNANLRANIVYNASTQCVKPVAGNQAQNSEYLSCLKKSQKRLITKNVKHFYNRWQKDAEGPSDYQRKLKAIDDNGNNVELPTATGRFLTEKSILEDQKRVFLSNSKQAHREILSSEARNLPRLLVKHLR